MSQLQDLVASVLTLLLFWLPSNCSSDFVERRPQPCLCNTRQPLATENLSGFQFRILRKSLRCLYAPSASFCFACAGGS